MSRVFLIWTILVSIGMLANAQDVPAQRRRAAGRGGLGHYDAVGGEAIAAALAK